MAPPRSDDPRRLCIDPSPTATGWTRGRNFREVKSGTRHWCAETGIPWGHAGWVGAVSDVYGRFLQHEINLGLDEIVIEQPGVPGGKGFDIWASGYVIAMFMRAVAIAEANTVPIFWCPNTSLKLWALGNGRAKAREFVRWARDVDYQCRSEHQGVSIALLEWARAVPPADRKGCFKRRL